MIDDAAKAIRRAVLVAKGLSRAIGPMPGKDEGERVHPASLLPGVHVQAIEPQNFAGGGEVQPTDETGFATGGSGMKFNTIAHADKALTAFNKMGLKTDRGFSQASNSHYLNVEMPGSDASPLKIRFGDHDLPTRYESPDYGVGPYSSAHGSSWLDAVNKASKHFDLSPPGYVSTLNAQNTAKAAASAAADPYGFKAVAQNTSPYLRDVFSDPANSQKTAGWVNRIRDALLNAGAPPSVAQSFKDKPGAFGDMVSMWQQIGNQGPTGAPTHNHVIFDPSIIDIKRRYKRGGGVERHGYATDGAVTENNMNNDPAQQKTSDIARQIKPEPPKAYFEVAPGKTWNPQLQQSWEQLHPQAKAAVSNKMIGEFLSPWQRQTGIHGEVRPGLGGFEGDTNPNYTFHPYNPAHIGSALHGLGTLFHQDAMMGAHAEPFEGSFPSGVVRIHLPPNTTPEHAHEVYKTLHSHGLAEGHSTDLNSGTMDILSGGNAEEAHQNAHMMDKALGGGYAVHSYGAHIAFPEHGADYASDTPPGSKRSNPSLSQANPGLHDQAAARLAELLAEAHKQGSGYKTKVDFGDTLAPGQLHPDVVSASMPTTVAAYKGPPRPGEFRQDISPGQHSQKNFDNIATRMWAQHPASGGVNLPAQEAAKAMTDFHVKNLLNVWDRTPEEQRITSRHWYRSAHALGNALADMHAVPPRAMHGIMAVLSPQNPWDTNVTQAERLADIMHYHQDTPWTQGMTHTVHQGGSKGIGLPSHKGTQETGPHNWSDIQGKTLRETLAGPHGELRGAMWVRAFDEAHNPSKFNSIAPTGEYGSPMLTPSGDKEATASWNSYTPIQKAISIWKDPSLENINKQVGSQHKVREFYNTITNPHDPNAVVVDTHAVAAGQMLPHGSSAKAVHQNFGTSPSNAEKENLRKRGDPWIDGVDPTKSTGSSGATGDYPFHAEAVRQAAWQRGVHPSEMQSVTWEAVRQLFKNKSTPMQNAARAIWSRFSNGDLNHEEAMDGIYHLFGGQNAPEWSGSAGKGTGNIVPGGSYQRPLHQINADEPALPRYKSTGGNVIDYALSVVRSHKPHRR